MITKKLLSLLKKASMFETEDELETFKNDFKKELHEKGLTDANGVLDENSCRI